MSLTIDIQQPFAQEWKRQINKLIDKTITTLKDASTGQEKHESVHTARKCFKKIRAALRLVRDEVDFYDEQNTFFRDLGRELSDVRDATSRLETVEKLRNHYDSKLYKNTFTELESALNHYRDKLANDVCREGEVLKEIAEKLKSKKEEVPHWTLDIEQFSELKPSVKRVYKRGKHRLTDCEKGGKTEDFHHWRKRAKYLRYQLKMLYAAWPAVLPPLEDELHEITDLLGEDHDLDVLKRWVQDQQFSFSQADEQELFEAISTHHQENLKKRALLLGERWYFQSPSGFTDRLEHYWEISKKLRS